MTLKRETPKELGIKIGSPLEVFWTRVRDAAKAELESAQHTIILQTAVIGLAEEKIKAEQESLRK